jgi:enolase
MATIKYIHARQILDSRGNPTIEVDLGFNLTNIFSAMVPSGASTGIYEAVELRDNTYAYGGKGVTKAVFSVNKIIKQAVLNKRFDSQKSFDEFLISLDNTPNKARLGANAILGCSLAFAKAKAHQEKKSLYNYLASLYESKFSATSTTLPIPFANVINGGVHAGNDLEMQEFMIAPVGAKSFSHATQMVSETYQELRSLLKKRFGPQSVNVGDEGGFAPPIKSASQALNMLTKTVDNLGFSQDIAFAMDPASSEFYSSSSNTYLKKKLSPITMQKEYEKLISNYPIISLEDPFDQDDFSSWKSFTKANGSRLQIVGDDLTVSSPLRVQLAIDEKLCNALLLKVNQIGTLTESLASTFIAKEAGWNVMVSHRSGETKDSFISDLAVGAKTGQIKLGAPCRSDRIEKYNRLLKIQEELGRKARFAKFKK